MRSQSAIHSKKAPPEFRPLGEYPRALRLTSELVDLRAADADRIPLRAERGRSPIR